LPRRQKKGERQGVNRPKHLHIHVPLPREIHAGADELLPETREEGLEQNRGHGIFSLEVVLHRLAELPIPVIVVFGPTVGKIPRAAHQHPEVLEV
jgi:hypothetical protein